MSPSNAVAAAMRRSLARHHSAGAVRPSRLLGQPWAMPPERVVQIRPRTVLAIAGTLVGLAAALWILYAARHVLTWVFVALFLALALDPAVRWLQRRAHITHRGSAAAVIYLVTLAAIAGFGFLLISPLIDQVGGLADAAPGYVHDLTAGRGPLGFL